MALSSTLDPPNAQTRSRANRRASSGKIRQSQASRHWRGRRTGVANFYHQLRRWNFVVCHAEPQRLVSAERLQGRVRGWIHALSAGEDGSKDNRTFYIYGYSFNLDSNKAVRSITLPDNEHVLVFAMTLVPSAAP